MNTILQKWFKKSAPKTETENPYLNARRTWNHIISGLVSSRDTARILFILCLLIVLVSVGGNIHIGSQSKFVPYVVEVNKLGEAINVSMAQRATPVDPRIVKASVASFISSARLVSPDVALQRKAIFLVYAMLAPKTPATIKMNEYLNGSEDATPFKRAETQMVSVDILSVLAQTSHAWQIDWMETIRDREGVIQGHPYPMRALVTVTIIPPNKDTTEAQIRRNPLGIYVSDYNWSKQVTGLIK